MSRLTLSKKDGKIKEDGSKTFPLLMARFMRDKLGRNNGVEMITIFRHFFDHEREYTIPEQNYIVSQLIRPTLRKLRYQYNIVVVSGYNHSLENVYYIPKSKRDLKDYTERNKILAKAHTKAIDVANKFVEDNGYKKVGRRIREIGQYHPRLK